MASEQVHSVEAEVSPAAVRIVPAVKLPSSDYVVESDMLSHSGNTTSSQNGVRQEGDALTPSEPILPIREEGMAEYSARKLRNALKDCRRLRRELSTFGRPSQSDGPALPSEVACPICSNTYDSALTLPLCLPCGHTVCSSCVLKLTRKTTVMCPFDRQMFDTDSASLPVNLSIVQAAACELSSAHCMIHDCQVIAYCVTSGSLLCGYCEHEERHKHILLDSQDAGVYVQEQIIALGQRLAEAWLVSKQISSHSLEVESLILRLTVKFNGFSLMHKATKQERRLSRRFAEALLKLRAELEESQKAIQGYIRMQACVYWNADSIERWQWLVWRLLPMPKMAKVGKAMEALQKWLKEDQ